MISCDLSPPSKETGGILKLRKEREDKFIDLRTFVNRGAHVNKKGNYSPRNSVILYTQEVGKWAV